MCLVCAHRGNYSKLLSSLFGLGFFFHGKHHRRGLAGEKILSVYFTRQKGWQGVRLVSPVMSFIWVA